MTGSAVKVGSSLALRLSLPCSLGEIRPAALAVSDFLREHKVPDEDIDACQLALVEACNNAVQYATPPGRLERILVDILCEPGAVEMRIHDRTPGFAWPLTAVLPEPDQERGRGLFLIRTLMDEARYYKSSGANCLVLRKERDPAPGWGTLEQSSSFQQLSHQLRESENIISDMAEELSFCYESLSAIFRCSAELGRSNKLEDFAQRLLSDLAQITAADWFVLRLLSRDGRALTVLTASEPALNLGALELSDVSEPVPLELQVARSRQDIWFGEEEMRDGSEPLGGVKPRSAGLIHPFFVGDQLVGTLAIGKAAGERTFTAVHANVVHTFADFLGIQMANARFQEEQVHARLVSRELEIARSIQRSLLPKALPRLPTYGLAGFCASARQVGGDFYDVVKYDEGSLLLIIADVMGKGLPAAMFAAILRSLLRAVPEWTNQPAHLLSRVNRLLFQELSGVDMFITAQLVFVDTTEGRLVTASAGHCPVLLASGDGCEVKSLSPEGLPLGILPDTTFGAQVEELTPQSRVLLYTDGLTEARNPAGELFGQERLLDWFRASSSRPKSAEELKNELALELGRFQSSTSSQDDQTFLIMA
jgi:serine phosphatase RsbU (regulator of sigma subunit)/anti-sigma regulatory factor (Ser/Thr protein kinase)